MEDLCFGDWCEAVDALLREVGVTPDEVGLVSEDLQEYADGEEAGDTPEEFVAGRLAQMRKGDFE